MTFPLETLKGVWAVSCLVAGGLAGLCYCLERYTGRACFAYWRGAWLVQAFWLALLALRAHLHWGPVQLLLEQAALGVCALLLLRGLVQFLRLRWRPQYWALAAAFLVGGGSVGAFTRPDFAWAQVPGFALLAWVGGIAARSFWHLRRRRKFRGAGLLTAAFALWALSLAAFPFLAGEEELLGAGLMILTALHLFLAGGMVVLILELAQRQQALASRQLQRRETETEFLRRKISSTEQRYRSLFDQASEGIAIVDRDDLHLLECNQTARRLLGVGAGPTDGWRLPQFFGGDAEMPHAPADVHAWFRQLADQPQLKLVRPDGRTLAVEANGAEVHWAGRPAYQVFLRDMTERVQLEEYLRQSEKLSALGRMISGVAHELNNPLASIQGYLELILARDALGSRSRTDLEKAAQETQRAARLVSNFLAFARHEAGQRSVTDFNELVRRVVELRRVDFSAAGVEWVLELQSDLPASWVDAGQIQQVLVNLVNNALHALQGRPEPRRVTIRTQHQEGRIRLSVEDTGPGIPEAIASRIFEPFFTTKEVGTGTGLGLSIAHRLVTGYGGRVFYRSGAAGGACFVVELPVVKPATAPAAPAENTPAPPITLPPKSQPLPGAEVLVLDDEALIAEMLAEILGLLGYRSTVCHTPAQALKLLGEHDYAVVLSDYRMPQMDGRQFYGAATRDHPELANRIVFLTGDTVSEDTQAFLASVGNPYLSKPFQLASIQKTVTAVLERSSQNSRGVPSTGPPRASRGAPDT